MATYKELLLDERWQTKRKEILKRDKFMCTKCLNERIIKDTTISQGLKITEGEKEPIIMYSVFILEKQGIVSAQAFLKEKNINYPIVENYGSFLSFYSNDKSIAINKIKNLLFYHQGYEKDNKAFNPLKFIAARRFLESEKKISQNITILGVPVAGIRKDFEWVYNNGLHVHHKYYKRGLYPWEYDDSALTTLCWICHEHAHAQKNIVFYDELGNMMPCLTPCKRCYGAGEFPEYHYVQNGICFRCEGAKYEELITI